MRTNIGLPSVLTLLLAACGGGGGESAGSPGGSGFLKGNITAVNGQSANVAGVTVSAASTGAYDVSGANGAFDLGSLPAGVQRIDVRTGGGAWCEIEIEIDDGASVRLRLALGDDGVERLSQDHCDDDDDGRTEARRSLVAQETGLRGHVEVRQEDDGDQGFEVEVERLQPGRQVDVVLVDPASETEQLLGSIVADEEGEAELELRTDDGEILPFDVSDVSELADLRVEVRDAATGVVLLAGKVPSIGSLPPCTDDDRDDDSKDDDSKDEDSKDDDSKDEDSKDEDSNDDDDSDDLSDDDSDDDDDRSGESRLVNQGLVTGSGEVEVRSRPGRGEEHIEIEVSDTNAVGALEVWIESPTEPGTLMQVGVLEGDDDDLEYERDTADGEALPFGVARVSELVGLMVEVRRASDGAVLFAGTVPTLRRD